MVDIEIAVTIMRLVSKGFKKIVFITGDKDFCPVLEYIEDKA